MALDGELHREVALKELHDQYAHDVDSRNRFVLEAEITGSLEHPGIVPIYGLGHHSDGRPYYAMRFIRGRSLKDEIADFYAAADSSTDDTGNRAVDFRRLLGRFVDVCQTIDFAHSCGVLHRDIKPSNIMLGRYGETLVVDWGLAKVVGRRGSTKEHDEGSLRPPSSDKINATMAGQVVGTPAYMSPEQASGRLDQLTPASDVYSLGATLYTLLTGVAPVRERTTERALEMVRAGLFDAPRAVNPETPRALEAVCCRAMSLVPSDRYASARELADDVERWLADEPVRAYRDPLVRRMSRWARRHRSIVAALAALVLTATVALGITTVLVAREQSKTAAQRNAAVRQRAALADLAKLESSITGRVVQAGQLEILLDSQDDLRQILKLQSGLAADFPQVEQYRADAAATMHYLARIRYATSDSTAAIQHLRQAAATMQRLVTDNRDNGQYALAYADILNSLGDILDNNEHLSEAEQVLRAANSTIEQQHVASDYAKHLRATVLVNLGNILSNDPTRYDGARAYFQQGIMIYRDALKQHPRNDRLHERLATALSNLAALLIRVDADSPSKEAVAVAERTLQEAAAEYKLLVAEHPAIPDHASGLAMVLHNLANLHHNRGELQQAKEELQLAIEHQTRAWQINPNNPFYSQSLSDHYWLLSTTLIAQHRPREALAAAEKMLPIRPTRWEDPYYAAGLAASCVAQLKVKPAANDDDKQLEEICAEQAVEWLREAIARGYPHADQLINDNSFRSVRDRSDFRSLVPDDSMSP